MAFAKRVSPCGGRTAKTISHLSLIAVPALVAIMGLSAEADALTLDIRPIKLVTGTTYNMTATGSISTAGNTSSITDWNLAVTTVEQLGHYTSANTTKSISGVSATSGGLTVATSPDSATADGGYLNFVGPNPFIDFGVSVADFSGANAVGGQASFTAGAAFDFLPLSQPDGTDYTVASSALGNVYNIQPLDFSGGVTLTGTIRTNGATGQLTAADILAWDIYVTQTTRDVFTAANSILVASLVGLTPDGAGLTVQNPGGSLMFLKSTVGGHPWGLQVADFSVPGGQAGYYQGRLAVTTIGLGGARGAWTVTGTQPVVSAVPLPPSIGLLGLALGFIGFAGCRRQAAQPT